MARTLTLRARPVTVPVTGMTRPAGVGMTRPVGTRPRSRSPSPTQRRPTTAQQEGRLCRLSTRNGQNGTS